MAGRDDAEFRLTCAVAQHLRLAATPGTVWLHVPNGEARSARTGARLKRMGVRRGVADFLVQCPGKPALMLELKAKGGRQSPEQRLFAEAWEAAGGLYEVATGIDEALSKLAAYGALPEGYGWTSPRRQQLPLGLAGRAA